MRNGRRVDRHRLPPDRAARPLGGAHRAGRSAIARRASASTHGARTMMVEGEPFTDEQSGYRFHSPEFLAALRARHGALRAATRRRASAPRRGSPTWTSRASTCRCSTRRRAGRCSAASSRTSSCSRRAAAPTTTGAPSTARRRPIGCAGPRSCRCRRSTLAIEEARRAAARGRGRVLRPARIRCCGRNLYHRDHEPLWAEVERLGVPDLASTTPGRRTCRRSAKRMETHTTGHIIAHPFEAMAAMVGPHLVRRVRALPATARRARRGRRRLGAVLAAAHGAALGLLRQRRASRAEDAADRVLPAQRLRRLPRRRDAPCPPPSSSPATTTSPSTPTTRIPTARGRGGWRRLEEQPHARDEQAEDPRRQRRARLRSRDQRGGRSSASHVLIARARPPTHPAARSALPHLRSAACSPH